MFHYHGAAGCQGGPHLPCDHGAGEIPLDQKREEASERKGWSKGRRVETPACKFCLAEVFLHTGAQNTWHLLAPGTVETRAHGDKNTFRV